MNEKKQTLSIKLLFADAKILFDLLLHKWLIIMLAAIIGGSGGILYAYLKKPLYTGDLSFVLSDGNSQNGIFSIANQFGIDLSGGGGNDVFSQDNVMYLMTSRKMMSRALFKTLPGTKELLINRYLSIEKIADTWKRDTRLASAYPFPDKYDEITPIQDSLFREIYTTITSKNLSVQQPDKKVSLFKVSTSSHDELFSCYLTKYIVQESSSFYIETKTSVARQNLTMIRHEADSLQANLYRSISSSATATDRVFNLNSALQVERVPIQRSQLDATVSQAAYAEVLKNLEIAKISLEKAYPIYQLLDEPSLPLKQEKLGRLLSGIVVGGILVLLVVVFYVVRFFLLRDDDKTGCEQGTTMDNLPFKD